MIVLGIGFVLVLAVTGTLSVALAPRAAALLRSLSGRLAAVAARFGRARVGVGVLIVGWPVTVLVLVPLGLASRAGAPWLDRPAFRWVSGEVHASPLTKSMFTLTVLGDRGIVELVVLVAGLILAFAYGRRWPVPVAALVVALVLQREAQVLLAHLVPRPRPIVVAAAGVFPSGGVSRILAVYGVVVLLSVRLLPAGRRAVWRTRGITGLVLFATIEAYSRVYLSLHWLTDVLTGFVLGALLLALETLALRVLDVPPRPASAAAGCDQQRDPTRAGRRY